jgi:hypothetical protein
LPFNFALLPVPWNARAVEKIMFEYESVLPADAWPNRVLVTIVRGWQAGRGASRRGFGRKTRFPFVRLGPMMRAMESHARQVNLVPAPDRRQSETALAIARGTARLLRSLGFACISELPLPSGRRADLVAINDRGEIWIVEIKSSLEDLRADQKWPEYRAHCDRLFFAFTQDLPCEIFPGDTGLIVADAYGAHMHCPAPEHRLPAPTRKSMTVRFAIAAAQRINRLVDPQGHAEF